MGSQPLVPAPKAKNTKEEGTFGTISYRLHHNDYTSLWHDVPLTPDSSSEENVINFINKYLCIIPLKWNFLRNYQTIQSFRIQTVTVLHVTIHMVSHSLTMVYSHKLGKTQPYSMTV